jgi:hypothetical protein
VVLLTGWIDFTRTLSGVWLPESMLCQFHIDWLISTGLPLAGRKYEVKRGGWQTRPDLLFTKIHARLFTNS